MAKIVSATRYPETQEIEYITDDFCRIVQNERTGEWTLFRIPSPNGILSVVFEGRMNEGTIEQYTAPIRYTPPQLADAPRHNAEVMDESDD